MRNFCVIMRDNKFLHLHLISPLNYIYQLILSNHLLQSLFETLLTLNILNWLFFHFLLQVIQLSLILKLSLFFLNHYTYRQTIKAISKNYVAMESRSLSCLRIVYRNEIATLFCSRFSTTSLQEKNELKCGWGINNFLYKLEDFLSECTALILK